MTLVNLCLDIVCNGVRKLLSFFFSKSCLSAYKWALIAGLKKWHKEIIVVLVVELYKWEIGLNTPQSSIYKKNWVMKFEALKQQIIGIHASTTFYIECRTKFTFYIIGVKVWNITMDFTTGGTWRWAKNTNDENLWFFYSAMSFSCLV